MRSPSIKNVTFIIATLGVTMAIIYQFLLAMLVGAISKLAGFTLNFAEQWVALSVIVFSLITIFVPRTSAILAIGIVSLFSIMVMFMQPRLQLKQVHLII